CHRICPGASAAPGSIGQRTNAPGATTGADGCGNALGASERIRLWCMAGSSVPPRPRFRAPAASSTHLRATPIPAKATFTNLFILPKVPSPILPELDAVGLSFSPAPLDDLF